MTEKFMIAWLSFRWRFLSFKPSLLLISVALNQDDPQAPFEIQSKNSKHGSNVVLIVIYIVFGILVVIFLVVIASMYNNILMDFNLKHDRMLLPTRDSDLDSSTHDITLDGQAIELKHITAESVDL
jgi:hypothetical protein